MTLDPTSWPAAFLKRIPPVQVFKNSNLWFITSFIVIFETKTPERV
jgi:hypothetical protein